MTSDDPTLDDYLDEWFALQRTRIEPTTWCNYAAMARYYIRPHLGTRHLSDLTVREIDRLYIDLLDHGGAPLT